MSKFHFRLKAVLRLREAVRDERRGELATVQRAAEALKAELAELAEELALVRRQQTVFVGPVNIEGLRESQRYELSLRGEIAHVERQQALVHAEVEHRRQLLVEADREVRALEKLRETQGERWHTEAERQATKDMDEAAARRRLG